MAQHRMIVHPLVLRQVHVTRVRDVTTRMRRITLGGEQLGPFHRDGLDLPGFASPGFDDHIKLIFASDGDVHAVLPTQVENGIEWAPSHTRQARDYTPRRFDPVAGELDLDFVRHGHGPAATWAQHARPGDELWFAGPKTSTVPPQHSPWVLLAGDETALPAIGRFFEQRPVDAPVRAVITVTDPAARQDLAVREDDLVEWVVADPGDEEALITAVRTVEALPGVPYVWAAAESRALLPLRRHATQTLGAPKTQINITGYWHKTTDDQPETATATAGRAAVETSPVGWFTVRAALRLGLLDALVSGPRSAQALARQLAVDPAQLDVLVDALAAHQVLTRDHTGRVGLGPVGEQLADDEHARERYDGLHADQVLALAELPAALTRGSSAWAAVHGRSLRELAQDDRAHYEELVEEAEGLVHLVTALPKRAVWGRQRRVGVTGPGALAVADILHEHTTAQVSIVEAPEPLKVLRDAAGDDCPHEFIDQWARHDVVATALALGHRTEQETTALLTELRTIASAAVLVERLAPDGLNPVAATEDALLHLATLGTPPPGPEQVARLAAVTGWTVTARQKLGWGIECVELTASEPDA